MPRVAIAIAVVLATTASHADPRAADRAADEADALGKAKNYLGAAAKFREAYAEDPRPELICNVGVAYYKAQELPRAQLFLGRCLERGSALPGAFIDVVRATLAKLETALKAGSYTPVDVVVEPRFATVAIEAFAADETFDGGRTVWLASGKHRVTVRAEGYRAQTVELDAAGHAIVPLRVTLVREPGAVAPDRPIEPAPPVTASPATAPLPPPQAEPARAPGLVLPVIATAATAGLAVFAIIARGQASSHADRAGAALDDASYQPEADSARHWNTIFGVDLAVAGAAAVASGYLWYRVLRAPAGAVTPGVEASGRGAALTITGRF